MPEHNNLKDCQGWREAGLYMSGTSNVAAKAFDSAIKQWVSRKNNDQIGGLQKTLKDMLDAEPDFVMGKVLKYGIDLVGGGVISTEICEDLSGSLNQAQKKHLINDRERMHLDAVKFLTCGHLRKACTLWKKILSENPTDMVALKLAYETYFNMGDQINIRDSVGFVIPKWNKNMEMLGYLKSMHAFGLEENNQFQKAKTEAQEALDINPHDGWAFHTLAHIFEMQGDSHKGIQFLTNTMDHWMTKTMSKRQQWGPSSEFLLGSSRSFQLTFHWTTSLSITDGKGRTDVT